MSVDRSLKSSNALLRHRNVLTRPERLAKLEDEGRWNAESGSVFGLPKVSNIKISVGKKEKKEVKTDEAEPTAETKS